MKTIKYLDQSVIDEFGDRKQIGRIDFVVDVNTGEFYPVPRDIEHKDFVPGIITGREKFIPSQLRLRRNTNNYYLIEIIIGASSYEATIGIRHHQRDLVAALNYTWDLINRSPTINPETIARCRILHTFQERRPVSESARY